MAPLKMQRAQASSCVYEVLTGHSETSNTRQGCLGMMRATSALCPPRDQQTPFPHPSLPESPHYLHSTNMPPREKGFSHQSAWSNLSFTPPTNQPWCQWSWSLAPGEGCKEGLWPKRVQCETRRIRSRFVLPSPPGSLRDLGNPCGYTACDC